MNETQQFERVAMMDILKSSQKKVQTLANKKGISITLSGKEAQVMGDKKGLITVFVSILENAIKYSPEKTEVTIQSKVKSQSVVVAVSDQGNGIKKHDLPHIFEQFYRADKSRSEEDGYGLGLSIARKIIHAHKGSIHVKSLQGKGSTFVISFPKFSV
jgi:signal transduction histidine kinase